jgi:rRNA-processing protein FCF1
MLFEFSINLEDELLRLLGSYKIVIPVQILNELKLLTEKGSGRQKRLAKPALNLAQRYEQINMVANTRADDALLSLSQQIHAAVVTNDKNLRKRLKEIHIPVLFLRGKHKLELE